MSDLTAFAVETAQKYAGLPIIMAGDFNTPEQSELYPAFMQAAGVRDAKYEAGVMIRSCSTFFGYQVTPDSGDTGLCVDHLFVSENVDVRLYNTVIGHDVQNASDHIPIYMDIDLK